MRDRVCNGLDKSGTTISKPDYHKDRANQNSVHRSRDTHRPITAHHSEHDEGFLLERFPPVSVPSSRSDTNYMSSLKRASNTTQNIDQMTNSQHSFKRSSFRSHPRNSQCNAAKNSINTLRMAKHNAASVSHGNDSNVVSHNNDAAKNSTRLEPQTSETKQ